MTELKPCPFCNGYAAIERFGTALTSTQYTCQHCGAFLETGEEFNHGNVWNTRPREARLEAEIADLRAKLVAYESAVWCADTHNKIIKRLMADVGMPNSMSLYGAFKQFANELHALPTMREEG